LYQGELLLIDMLFEPVFGDLYKKLGLRDSEAIGGHWTSNGSSISFTIRVAPEWRIDGKVKHQFAVLPYTAHVASRKKKCAKNRPSIVTDEPANLSKLEIDTIFVGIDMGTLLNRLSKHIWFTSLLHIQARKMPRLRTLIGQRICRIQSVTLALALTERNVQLTLLKRNSSPSLSTGYVCTLCKIDHIYILSNLCSAKEGERGGGGRNWRRRRQRVVVCSLSVGAVRLESGLCEKEKKRYHQYVIINL
jgi:hypothetical protein